MRFTIWSGLVCFVLLANPASAGYATAAHCEPVAPVVCATGTIITSTVANSYCSGTPGSNDVCKKIEYSGTGQAFGPQTIRFTITGTHGDYDECEVMGTTTVALCYADVTDYLFVDSTTSHCWTLVARTYALIPETSTWYLMAEANVELDC